jgi:HAMP domain-containing protein
MVRDLRIQSKLIGIFALPVLGMLLLTSARIVSTVDDGLAADDDKRAIGFTAAGSALAHELEAERDLSVAAVSGSDETRPAAVLDTQRDRVDQALNAWRTARTTWHPDRSDRRVQAALAIADTHLGTLEAVRHGLDDGTIRPPQALKNYTEVVERLLDAADAAATASPHPDLERQLSTASALARAKELTSLERGLMAGVLVTGRFGPGDYQQLAMAVGARDRELARVRAAATGQQLEALSAALASRAVRRSADLEQAALAGEHAATLNLDPGAWWSTMTARVDALRRVEQQLERDMATTNRASILTAEGQLLNDLLIVLIVLVATFALAAFLARSMINPLTALHRAANDVAEHQLPGVVQRLQQAHTVDVDAEAAPVEIGARDEIGRVAEAFNSVQRVAIQVATEQATLRRSVGELFVNLARRAQSLIARQLQLIDELEQGETDPERLESLFRLDHMATQMRRNAESLVVLSSSTAVPRWSQPVTLVNLVRSAIAEVEDYERVEMLPIHDVRLVGQVGIDVVHLLAELIENATRFSAPSTKVTIAGETVPHGYLLEIEDRGLGMNDDELAAANRRLAHPSDLELPPGQMLGLFVVARLAARHSIKVQLRHSWYEGVTALVLLPTALIAAGTSGEGAGPVLNLLTEPARQLDERETDPHVPLRRHPRSVSTITLPAPPPVAAPTSTAAAEWTGPQAESGLPRRTPLEQLTPQLASEPVPPNHGRSVPLAGRSPEAVRDLLSSYQQGLQQGRAAGTTPDEASPGEGGSGSRESGDRAVW